MFSPCSNICRSLYRLNSWHPHGLPTAQRLSVVTVWSKLSLSYHCKLFPLEGDVAQIMLALQLKANKDYSWNKRYHPYLLLVLLYETFMTWDSVKVTLLQEPWDLNLNKCLYNGYGHWTHKNQILNAKKISKNLNFMFCLSVSFQ